MGGTDDESNLIELSIEDHAEAHRILYEKHGYWQDYVAWKGLLGLLTSDECALIAMRNGSFNGSIVRNGGLNYTNGSEVKKFLPENVPEGWKRSKYQVRTPGVGSGTKKRKWYHNPTTNKKICLLSSEKVPEGYVPGQGKKKKVKCYWYNNDIEEGQFELDKGPTGWKRGRLKRVSKGAERID